MSSDSINDARTIVGNEEGNPSTEKGTPMDKSIGDGPTMRSKEERGRRGAFAPGDIIARRYVVERMLGEGGMGIVYQCLDTIGGVSVAVKCLPPEVSRNADEMEDIRANYRLVFDLRHQNIAGARTLELDESMGDYYLVMDLARGMSLKRWMRRNPQATTDAKLAILRQVAAALDYAHAQKVIHRDVKPENVMVDDNGRVKVLDFGLAAQIRSSQSRTSNAVTSRGGTPGYKSPEQWRGKPQREPADVYSFGVMAYWMFAGALPFDGDDPVVLGHAVLTEPVEPIAGLSAHMNDALVKALAKKPEERFTSCGAVVDALEGKNVHVDGVGGAMRPAEPVGARIPRDRDDMPQLVGRRVPMSPQSGRPRPLRLTKALAKKPEERFASYGEVVDALEGKKFSHVERVEGGNGRTRSPSGPQSVGSRPVAVLKGKYSRFVTVVVVAVLGLAIIGGLWWFGGRTWTSANAKFKSEWERRKLKGAEAGDNGHTKVQLWESGPYWADTNIGAEKPWDHGYYFWWGDTKGYKRVNDAWVASDGSSSNFSFGKDKDTTTTWGKSNDALRNEGWITKEGVLALKYDAARVHWGGGWRMPTKQELDDLSSKCDWEWASVNGVKGFSVRGRGAYASERIFLPCAGYGDETSLYGSGSFGYYWSSVPYSDNFNSWSIYFYSGRPGTSGDFRYYGFSVRPVKGFTK